MLINNEQKKLVQERKVAPVVLFVYNRLAHTQKTVEALKKNEYVEESKFIIYSDGPKNELDTKKVEELREYLDTLSGFKSINIIKREKNWGLAANIIDGVTEVVKVYGKVIVLEDDLVTSPFFLRYMNDALETYSDNKKVGCIHGYIYPVKDLKDDFFLKGADCWGWATWDRAWSGFEQDGKKLFDRADAKGYMTDPFNIKCGYVQMLKDQISGKNNSWAIRWYFSSLVNDLYCLYPSKSYIMNIGLDDTGTHCKTTSSYDVQLQEKYSFKEITVVENAVNKKKITKFYSKQSSLLNKVFNKLRRLYQ